jgi:hypothetical protein
MALVKIGSDNLDELDVKLGNIPLRWKITPPTGDGGITFPENAYYLEPDVNGNFTKAMIETAAADNDYIVFDAETLDIHYDESPINTDYQGGERVYLTLEDIQATELNPLTLDFRKVKIDCFHDENYVNMKHDVFHFIRCANINLKFGIVEGDKYKRAFATDAEIKLDDHSIFIRAGRGSQNLVLASGDISGFIADVFNGMVNGGGSINFTETAKQYYIQPDGRYESISYTVDTVNNEFFGLVGGVGFNRLLKYDMEDVTFKFYDASDNYVSELNNCQYFESYAFPAGVSKMRVNVNALNGRTESPTRFEHRLDYNPNNSCAVRDMRIGDNHRGGIANIGASAIIENNEFYTSDKYYTVPSFSDTTRYHINCEDAVSRNLIIRNNTFATRFNQLLLTHNLNADITNNTFTNGGNSDIFIYQLVYGTIRLNHFSNAIVEGGTGTNKGLLIISENTGSPKVQLSNGAEWKFNTFSDGLIKNQGKANNNTFTNYNVDRLKWTKEIRDNNFFGIADTSITLPNVYVYRNNFTDATFRFADGNSVDDLIVFDTVAIDNTNSPNLDGFYRSYGDAKIISKDSTFTKFKINSTRVNEDINFEHGNWYFENCDFLDIENYLIILGSNNANNIPEKFYFKNCTFTGSGLIASNTIYGGMTYEVIFEDCTIDPLLTMPTNYTEVTTGTIVMPTLVEPRTQPIPNLEWDDTNIRTIVRTAFHYFTLIIRNKNTQEIILNDTVIGGYTHYNNTPNDFEYSIDGGVYWDSLVSGIVVTPPTSDLTVPNTLQLTATVTPDNAFIQTVNWTTSDELIATVNSSGLVTSVGAGIVTISGTTEQQYGERFTDTCIITVTA